jgi:polyphosphate kinase 2
MAKGKKHSKNRDGRERMKRKAYEAELRKLQVKLCHLQEWVKKKGLRVIIAFEGRDAAGKGGTIRAITERVSPRVFRIVALPAPSERQKSQLFLQRYIEHFPAAGEVVIFDRSWYNRAGVEHVMGFCRNGEYETFLEEAPQFEAMLVRSGIKLVKYYLDISKEEQKERLADRRADPLKQWKISPIDAAAIKKWKEYSEARDAMFMHTSHDAAPWHIVKADVKKTARLNVIRHLLNCVDYKGKDEKLLAVDPDIVFGFSEKALTHDLLAH